MGNEGTRASITTQKNTARPWLSTDDGVGYCAEAALEVLRSVISTKRYETFESVLRQRLTSLVLGIEDLHQSHNGAACLRSAEGLGIHRVIAAELRHAYPLSEPLSESFEIPRLISTSAHRWLELNRVPSSEGLFDWCRAEGLKVYGAGPRGQLTVGEIPVDQPLCVLFGNEKDGLRPGTLDACDEVFRIPMYGFTESFNISVSVGMTLQQLGERRRQLLSASGQEGELAAHTQLELLANWALRDLRGGKEILRHKLGAPQPLLDF